MGDINLLLLPHPSTSHNQPPLNSPRRTSQSHTTKPTAKQNNAGLLQTQRNLPQYIAIDSLSPKIGRISSKIYHLKLT